MKLTNRNNLPEALVRAVANDPYNKGAAEFSVTELLSPPRQAALKAKHWAEIEEDVEDRLWSLYGQVAHSILERASGENAIAEKRYFGKIGDATVSAQVDTLDLINGELSDFKFTTAYKFKVGAPPSDEWIAQLNMQAELLRQNGVEAKYLWIVGLLRDFSKLEAIRTPDYPKSSVVRLPIPRWHTIQTQAYMLARIQAHRAARAGELPLCTDEERWAKPATYAVMKKDAKRATRVFEDRAAAETLAATSKDLTVVARPGANTRCEFFCSAAAFCSQNKLVIGPGPSALTPEEGQTETEKMETA